MSQTPTAPNNKAVVFTGKKRVDTERVSGGLAHGKARKAAKRGLISQKQLEKLEGGHK